MAQRRHKGARLLLVPLSSCALCPAHAHTHAGGRGRQAFFFHRRHDTWHLVGFQVFSAIPFLYELRALLDWTCTATSLSWYNWLKLEDVRTSLFLNECNIRARARRRLGERVPRYVKFLQVGWRRAGPQGVAHRALGLAWPGLAWPGLALPSPPVPCQPQPCSAAPLAQGTLLLALLLLIIWTPLLVFSSGAPTYAAPALTALGVNVSVTGPPPAAGPGADGGVLGLVELPLMRAGHRWGGPGRGAAPGVPGRPPPRPSNTCNPHAQPPAPPACRFSLLNWAAPNASLPPGLASYEAAQVRLACAAQDSDTTWHLTPPARAALQEVLQQPGAALLLSWGLLRSAPLATARGGPQCSAAVSVPLSGRTRAELSEVLGGSRALVQLQALNASDPRGHEADHGGPAGLYPLVWRVRRRLVPGPAPPGARL
jgi:hypothetical protein